MSSPVCWFGTTIAAPTAMSERLASLSLAGGAAGVVVGGAGVVVGAAGVVVCVVVVSTGVGAGVVLVAGVEVGAGVGRREVVGVAAVLVGEPSAVPGVVSVLAAPVVLVTRPHAAMKPAMAAHPSARTTRRRLGSGVLIPSRYVSDGLWNGSMVSER